MWLRQEVSICSHIILRSLMLSKCFIHPFPGTPRSLWMPTEAREDIGRIRTTWSPLWIGLNRLWASNRYFLAPSFHISRSLVPLPLSFFKPKDWYSVTLTELKEAGPLPTQLTRLQLAELLEERYPNYKFNKVFLLRGRFAQQKRLERAILSLFKVVVTCQRR